MLPGPSVLQTLGLGLEEVRWAVFWATPSLGEARVGGERSLPAARHASTVVGRAVVGRRGVGSGRTNDAQAPLNDSQR